MKKISLRATAVAVAALAAGQAWATNGMLMEGYGPIALSMGGAATAYDNGTAAMMNNVATLQLGENGTRADLAIGVLGPNVTAGGQKSGGTSYVMPAVGWTQKNDQFTYGVGLFAQGGMGTEFANAGQNSVSMGTGSVRSELGVGRLIFPLSYKVNEQLSVGASLDYAWAGLDMKMAASANAGGQAGAYGANVMDPLTNPAYYQLEYMYAAGNGITPSAAAFDNMEQTFTGMAQQFTNNNFTRIAGVRLDFSNSSDFTGAAKSTGFTGKLGFVFKPQQGVALGMSYQPKTNLADMTTSSTGATFTILDTNGQNAVIPGKIIVRNFQMPAVTAVGIAVDATPRLKLAMDVKSIGWKSVMEKFNMTFDMGGGQTMNFAMDQHWKDQTVVSLGAAYVVDEKLVLRAGYSGSTNPVPNDYVHPLFPATIKDQYTFGVGYAFGKNALFNMAVSHAPKVTAVNTATSMAITHSQTNYQLMLSYRY